LESVAATAAPPGVSAHRAISGLVFNSGILKIPLNPPLKKGDFKGFPPFAIRNFKKLPSFVMGNFKEFPPFEKGNFKKLSPFIKGGGGDFKLERKIRLSIVAKVGTKLSISFCRLFSETMGKGLVV
jgi:hypothetical protein